MACASGSTSDGGVGHRTGAGDGTVQQLARANILLPRGYIAEIKARFAGPVTLANDLDRF